MTSLSIAVHQPTKKQIKSVQSAAQAPADSEHSVSVDDDSEPMDELTKAKLAIKAWQSKANSLQKRNELLETEILLLKNESAQQSMTNGEVHGDPESEAEAEDVEVDEIDHKNEDEEDGDDDDDNDDDDDDDDDDEPPRSRAELKEELDNTKEQLAEMTELYEGLLQQRNNEMRLRRYSTVDSQSVKAKVTELQVQIDQLKVKHREELLKKDDELRIIEERGDRDRTKASTLRKELETVKTENVNLLLEKKKLERSLQKVYSAKQKRRELAEDSIKEIEVSTLRLKNNRLQMELQRTQTSPTQLMYGSQENLLDSSLNSSLNRSQEFDSSAFPPSTDSKERELETEIDSLKEEIAALNTKLSSESEQKETMAKHWEQQLTDSEEKVNTLQDELKKENHEVELLTHELEIAETSVDELTKKLEETEAELALELKEREDEFNEINEALEDAQGQLRNIPSDTVLLQQKVQELQEELEETKRAMAETKKQLDKEIIAVSWKNQEIAQLRSKLQE